MKIEDFADSRYFRDQNRGDLAMCSRIFHQNVIQYIERGEGRMGDIERQSTLRFVRGMHNFLHNIPTITMGNLNWFSQNITLFRQYEYEGDVFKRMTSSLCGMRQLITTALQETGNGNPAINIKAFSTMCLEDLFGKWRSAKCEQKLRLDHLGVHVSRVLSLYIERRTPLINMDDETPTPERMRLEIKYILANHNLQ